MRPATILTGRLPFPGDTTNVADIIANNRPNTLSRCQNLGFATQLSAAPVSPSGSLDLAALNWNALITNPYSPRFPTRRIEQFDRWRPVTPHAAAGVGVVRVRVLGFHHGEFSGAAPAADAMGCFGARLLPVHPGRPVQLQWPLRSVRRWRGLEEERRRVRSSGGEHHARPVPQGQRGTSV